MKKLAIAMLLTRDLERRYADTCKAKPPRRSSPALR